MVAEGTSHDQPTQHYLDWTLGSCKLVSQTVTQTAKLGGFAVAK